MRIDSFMESLMDAEKEIKTRETFNSSGIQASFTFRQSWDVKTHKSANSEKTVRTPKASLLQRLEQTKKKSM